MWGNTRSNTTKKKKRQTTFYETSLCTPQTSSVAQISSNNQTTAVEGFISDGQDSVGCFVALCSSNHLILNPNETEVVNVDFMRVRHKTNTHWRCNTDDLYKKTALLGETGLSMFATRRCISSMSLWLRVTEDGVLSAITGGTAESEPVTQGCLFWGLLWSLWSWMHKEDTRPGPKKSIFYINRNFFLEIFKNRFSYKNGF